MKLKMVESNKKSQFSYLAKALYDTFKIKKAELVQDMLENIVCEDKIDLVKRSSDSYYNYFKGADISPITSRITTFVDADRFGTWLSELLYSENSNEKLYNSMINNGFKDVTIDGIVDDTTKIFVKIIEGIDICKSAIRKKDSIDIDEIKIEEVLDNPLNSINDGLATQMSKKIEGVARLGDTMLRDKYGDKISQYYGLKPKLNNNKLQYFITAKTDEAFKELPLSTNLKFDLKNCTEEEKYNATHMDEVIKNIDYNNKPIAFPPILEAKKVIDSQEIPNELFEMDETQGKLYMLPNSHLPKYNFSFKVFNSELSVEINRLELVRIVQTDRIIYTNNNRNKNERYVLDIIADNITLEHMDLHYAIRLKPEYAKELSTILEFYKINRLLGDKTANLRIVNTDQNLAIISIDGVGKSEYSDVDKKATKRFISDFEKLIYIENYYNFKFKFDIDFMQKNLSAIEIVYASITGKEMFLFQKGMNFSLALTEEYKNMKEGDFLHFESDLEDINLFDKHLELKNTTLKFDKARIESIDKEIKKINLSVDFIEVSCKNKKNN